MKQADSEKRSCKKLLVLFIIHTPENVYVCKSITKINFENDVVGYQCNPPPKKIVVADAFALKEALMFPP